MNTLDRPWSRLHQKLGLEVPAYDHATPAGHVRKHAQLCPDAPALYYQNVTLSYVDLDLWSQQFASTLLKTGFRANDRLGVLLPNVPEYAVATIGCSCVGGVVSGLSTLLTSSELVYQLNDSQVSSLVITETCLREKLLPILPELPHLKVIIATGGTQPDAAVGKNVVAFPVTTHHAEQSVPVADRKPDDLLFIQYTGGTTGLPKGAMLSVCNVMYDAQLYGSPHALEPYAECVATAFPLYHMAGMSLWLLTLLFGGSFTLIPDPRDIKSFCAMMQRHPPTVLGAVPTLYQMLMQAPEFSSIDFSRLKVAMSGGAPFPVATKLQLETIIGAHKLSDNFGMTETGPVYVNNPKTRLKHASVGIPLPGVDVRIVDVDGGTRTLPCGEQGEIITTGPHVMKGYFNNFEATASALRELDGRIWMYTGDVGYMDEDGYIYLCDRIKDMAVVGGYKVFSVEVEDKLRCLAFIDHAALIAIPDSARVGSDVLHLFVQLNADAVLKDAGGVSSEIVDFCRAEMAPYKIPRHIHIIDDMPMTAIGKLDKKVLRTGLAKQLPSPE